MDGPIATRPHMPGYGIAPASAGLLPWRWADERLCTSHDYWLATVTPAGLPHLMPVWAVWTGEVLWFSSSLRSVKARNVAAGSAVSVATEDPEEPVVVSGPAELVADAKEIREFLDAMNAKYETAYGIDFLDPAVNASVRVRPETVFALREKDFTTSPTRWEFTS
ncbi:MULTISPECIES: pyridoxamine 5'-phosphate oxidase family protein [unclassified Amycolatopsis]|uniref:pyridoxamine 5'-phosphate oxidase family protein n=1 Tax=unclassified Amycolatopsis TaxID=2618356 RepID=UPI001C6A27EA|nr:pyridoxamine 5'-phosphate oxidase family protein [Amycolatopsis sp. DSM 110486]QYN17261.1 pyridoxamine 5'-phosphate oxidase family protein [Amycolatopsis sp. DSM 110486]